MDGVSQPGTVRRISRVASIGDNIIHDREYETIETIGENVFTERFHSEGDPTRRSSFETSNDVGDVRSSPFDIQNGETKRID